MQKCTLPPLSCIIDYVSRHQVSPEGKKNDKKEKKSEWCTLTTSMELMDTQCFSYCYEKLCKATDISNNIETIFMELYDLLNI